MLNSLAFPRTQLVGTFDSHEQCIAPAIPE